MASSIIEAIASGIHSVLWATGAFASGYPTATVRTGTRPTFNVWWSGCSLGGPEVRSDRGPVTTTFRYVLELRVDLPGDEAARQGQLQALVQQSVNALVANHRLGVAGVLRSRVTAVEAQIEADGNQAMLVAAIQFEADYAGAWTAPS